MPELRSEGDSWTFLHVNDSHMGTPRSYRFRPAINRRWAAIHRQMAKIDAEFLLHGSDLCCRLHASKEEEVSALSRDNLE